MRYASSRLGQVASPWRIPALRELRFTSGVLTAPGGSGPPFSGPATSGTKVLFFLGRFIAALESAAFTMGGAPFFRHHRAAMPNPSLKLSPNGVPPGPRPRIAYHRPRGPGVTPSWPA
jgi:hypothetical protein